MVALTVNDLPDGTIVTTLHVKSDLPYVPSVNFKSATTRLSYRVNPHVKLIEVLQSDVEHLSKVLVNKESLFTIGDNRTIQSTPIADESTPIASTKQSVQTQPMELIDPFDFVVIKGIGQATSDKLHTAGILTLDDFINASIEQKSELGIAGHWIAQAQALLLSD